MTELVSPDARITELKALLRRYSRSYYNGEAEISDEEYDALEMELRELTGGNADALAEVGASPSGHFETVQHDPPMLSLDKAQGVEGLNGFLARHEGQKFILWPKFDGVSLALRYRDGELVQALTRGDGTVGEDISTNVIGHVKGAPATLPNGFTGEVRGEAVMLRSDFERFNQVNERQLKNPRNAVSGTLRTKNPADVKDRPVTFMAFDVVGAPAGKTVTDALTDIEFRVERAQVADSPDEVWAYINEIEQARDQLDYEIDGVVIRVADPERYRQLGTTSHHPRGAIAYKFAAEVQTTTLNEVVWQVGKSGRIAPVGQVSPVLVAGTTISQVSLHNLEIIAARDIRVGDRVQIRRAGDVIPHVIGPITDERDGTETPITSPTECPSCNGPVTVTGASKLLSCDSSDCVERTLRRLVHWASRAAADIEAVGPRWIERLHETGLVERPSDFYKLDRETLLATFTEGMRDRSADRMITSIDRSRQVGLRRALIGLSIPLASEGTAKRLCHAGYETLEQVADATVDDLIRVEDVGELVAESIVSFFTDSTNRDEITRLRAAGVNLDRLDEDTPVQAGENGLPLDGKRFCITGTLSAPRSQIAKQIEQAGGTVASTVSSKLDFLVAGEKAGSKLTKAEQAGVAVITEQQLNEMING